MSAQISFVEDVFPFQSISYLEVNTSILLPTYEAIMDANPFIVIKDESAEKHNSDTLSFASVEPKPSPSAPDEGHLIRPATALPINTATISNRVVKWPAWLHEFVHKTRK